MGRAKKYIDGEAATERMGLKITPKLNRELDLVATLLDIDKGDIARTLLANYVDLVLKKIEVGELTNETIERVFKKQTAT